jgi:hypothetical protein
MTGTTRRLDAAAISAAVPSTYLGVRALSAIIGPGLSKDLSNSFADAASGPGDEDDFPRNIEFDRHHGVFSLMWLRPGPDHRAIAAPATTCVSASGDARGRSTNVIDETRQEVLQSFTIRYNCRRKSFDVSDRLAARNILAPVFAKIHQNLKALATAFRRPLVHYD